MADENNAVMQDDFFSDTGIIDQDTGEDIIVPDTGDGQQSKIGGQQQAPQVPVGGTANQPAEQQQQTQQAETFEQRFMKDGEYDVQAGLNFVTGTMGQINAPDIVSQMMMPVQKQQQPIQQQPEKEPWEVQYEQRSNYHNEVLTQRTAYRKYMEEAAQAGYQGQDILNYADRKINDDVTKEVERWGFRTAHERAESEKNTARERQEFLELMPKSRANLAEQYEKIGGVDKFNDLIFGRAVQGKNGTQSLNGYGVQAVNLAYRLQNVNAEIPSDPKEAAEHYQKWWTKFTAEKDNLQLVVNMATANLQLAQMKYLMRAARGAGSQNASMQKQARQPAPSQVQKQPASDPNARGPDDPLGIMSQPDWIG